MNSSGNSSNKIYDPVCTLWMEDGILHVVGNPGHSQDIKDATRVMDLTRNNFTTNGPVPMFLDMTGYKGVSRSAREYYVHPNHVNVFSGVAFLTKSLATRILANMFLGFNKAPFPIRLFDNNEKGKQWLQQFKGDQNEMSTARSTIKPEVKRTASLN